MKPPRLYARKHVPAELVARVLYEADLYGDVIAAQRIAKHPNTVRAWRRERGSEPAVVAALDAIRAAVRSTWIGEAVEARTAALRKVSELVKSTKSLRAAASAASTLHEIILSHQVLGDAPDDHGDHQHPGDRPGGDQREAQGASGPAHGADDEADLGRGEG